MARFIFILGRNWRLSLAEINMILSKAPYEGRIIDYSASAAIVELDKETKDKNLDRLMFQLGGTQKIGTLLDFVDKRTLLSAFPEEITLEYNIQNKERKRIGNILKDVVFPVFGKIQPVKYFIANSIYAITFQKTYYKTLVQHFLPFANKEWITILKSKGAKNVVYYRYPEEKIEKGTLNPLFPHHFWAYNLFQDYRKELLYVMTEEGMYIGVTINVTNANEIKKLDEERPYKDPKSSIPPKFAKIMIQLLNLNRPFGTNRILDPFCGSGTILMFAHSLGIQTFGMDIDQERIKGTMRNLKWISKILENPRPIPSPQYKVGDIVSLATIFEKYLFDGIISEPYLVPFYRDLPRYAEIEEVMEKTVIPSYTALFSEGFKILKSNHRIVVTSPSIETVDGGRYHIELESIADEHGFSALQIYGEKPIPEKVDPDLQLFKDKYSLYDDKSEIIRRRFHIFEKQP